MMKVLEPLPSKHKTLKFKSYYISHPHRKRKTHCKETEKNMHILQKMFTSDHVSGKGLVPRVYEEFVQFNHKTTTQWAQDLYVYFSKEGMYVANNK
jgi:hypothetical protein